MLMIMAASVTSLHNVASCDSGAESFHSLLKMVGNDVAKNIILSQIVYPKTESIKDKSITQKNYNGTLLNAIQEIEADINLKAIDAVADAVEVLRLMEEFKESILLNQADCVVIYKGGFDIVMLTNEKLPTSGRSIYIELNSSRNELIRYIKVVRGEQISWLQICTAIGVVTITAVNVIISIANNFK
jgi:hypothetical protein